MGLGMTMSRRKLDFHQATGVNSGGAAPSTARTAAATLAVYLGSPTPLSLCP